MKEYVDVFTKPYLIEYKENEEMQDCSGFNNPHFAKIFIDKTMAQCHQDERLIHEVLHVIDDEMDLSLKEHQVAVLAVSLYAMGFRIQTRLEDK